jgi:EAL domain-containing protein (putative c-di-GMP-specific phosphodiesterase class I)/PAS domain-containing protein
MEDSKPEAESGKLILGQVDDLYGNLGYTNAAVILISAFLAWILWPVAGSQGLVPWLSCVLLLNLWNILLSLLYKRARIDESNVHSWLKTYIAGIFLSGLVWGSLLLFVVPPSATVHLLATSFIVAGLVTGSAATLASLKFGFAVFSVPAILPGVIYLIYLNQSVTFIIGCSLVSFLVFILFFALRIHRTIYYSLRKQMEVSNKLALLEIEKEELQHKFDQLKHRLEAEQAELGQLRIALKHKPLPGASLRRANDFRDLRFVSLLDSLSGGVWDLNMKTGELVFSPGWLEMMGFEPNETTRHMDFWTSLLHPDDKLTVLNKLHAFAGGSLPEFASSHRLRTGRGEWVWVMARAHGVIWGGFGELLNIAGMELHVPESGEAAGKSLDLLNFDINAWLFSAENFNKRFQQLIATASLEGIEHSLCYIRILRIDDEGNDNDSLNEIRVYEVGRVLLNEFRHGDALMRLGNNSFALLLAFCQPEHALEKAQNLQRSLNGLQVNFRGVRYALATGIGIAPITASAGGIDAIMHDAEAACELALSCTSDLVYLHHRDSRLRIQATPMQALAEDAAAAGQVLVISAGFEGQPQAAANLQTIARNNHLASSVDAYLVSNIVEWLEAEGARHDGIMRTYLYECTNESCLDQGFRDLVTQQFSRLRTQGIRLCLGVPVQAWSAQPEAAMRFINDVRKAGGKIALIGFDNPATVHDLITACPVDYLKLNPALLDDLEQNPSNGITIKYINEMIHLAGIKSIVEQGAAGPKPGQLQAMNIDFLQAAPTTPSGA